MVVAGVDASEHGAQVARAAGAVAARLGLPLALLHVEPPPIAGAAPHVAYVASWDGLAADLGTLGVWLEAFAEEAGVPPGTELRVEVGSPVERLLAASEAGTALLVVGAPRRRRLRGGGVVPALLAGAGCPVLVVPREWTAGEDWSPRTVLCGVDGTTASATALQVAGRLAGRLDAQLLRAHVERPGGDAAARLADLADAEDEALLAVGSRGRGPFRTALLGSVSNRLVRIARRPVLVVPPAAGAAATLGAWQAASPASRSRR